ncbi:MAG: tetratricopeptide repeat protein, partial [Actinomycetota bacterium]|nr:tetratricopeptide repeat protein [Actinomycetota bacterium]
AYADLGEVDKAIRYYEQALEIAREIRDRSLERIVSELLGNAHAVRGNDDRAAEYRERARRLDAPTDR